MQIAVRLSGAVLLGLVLTFTAAWADQGLLPADDQKIPEKVREKFASVFRVVVLTQGADGKVPRLPEKTYRGLEEQFSDDGFMGDLIRKRGAHYREKGETEIPIEINSIGSAFLLEGGDRLVTVMHYFRGGALEYAFTRMMRSREKAEIRGILSDLTGGKVHFLLFDMKGTLVFDTRNGTDIALLKAMPDLRQPYSSRRVLNALDLSTVTSNDLLVFELNKKLGLPLILRDKAPEVGDALFAPGFSIKTTDREKKFKAKDANGFEIVCSVGKVIDAPILAQYTKTAPSPEEAEALEALTREKLLLGDIDGEEGMSGGPVLDEEGRVVSLQRMSFREADFVGKNRRPVHDKYASLSVMLRTEELKSSITHLEDLLKTMIERLK